MGVFITSCEVHRRLLEIISSFRRERERNRDGDRQRKGERLKQAETSTE